MCCFAHEVFWLTPEEMGLLWETIRTEHYPGTVGMSRYCWSRIKAAKQQGDRVARRRWIHVLRCAYQLGCNVGLQLDVNGRRYRTDCNKLYRVPDGEVSLRNLFGEAVNVEELLDSYKNT